jgi:cell fate regulator YaaT (PSP1 superfamily)
MPTVVGIRFKKAGKIYYFDPEDTGVQKGDYAIVETARGMEYGEVVAGARSVDEKEIVPPLKSVLRKATKADRKRLPRTRCGRRRPSIFARAKSRHTVCR